MRRLKAPTVGSLISYLHIAMYFSVDASPLKNYRELGGSKIDKNTHAELLTR
jgi:hypothetical protein